MQYIGRGLEGLKRRIEAAITPTDTRIAPQKYLEGLNPADQDQIQQLVAAFLNIDIPVSIIARGMHPFDTAENAQASALALSIVGRDEPLAARQIDMLREYTAAFFKESGRAISVQNETSEVLIGYTFNGDMLPVRVDRPYPRITASATDGQFPLHVTITSKPVEQHLGGFVTEGSPYVILS